jgi:uncharacterized protein (DUF2147 family)
MRRRNGAPVRASRLALSLLTLASVWSADARSAARNSYVAGLWMTDDGDGAVEIRPCGNELCGYIHAMLRLPHPERPALDDRNTNAALRRRPLCGLQVIGGLHAVASGQWGGGWIYDPKAGKTYGLELTLQDRQLSVHGTLQGTFLGRTVTWSRPTAPPAKCVAPRPQR